MSFGVKQLPLALKLGMCLPKECTPEIMENAMAILTNTTNKILGPLLKDPPVSIPLPTDIVPEFIFRAVSSDYWLDEKRDQQQTKAFVVMGIVCGLVFLV
jgi:hypothetical protein